MEKGDHLRNRLAVRDAWPDMPEGITDRNADVWEALFSVADAAGGEWPNRARVAAVALVALTRRGEGSMGIRLLTDIRTVFGARDVMRTKDLLNALIDMEESVWADLKGNPMTDRGLARRLQPYDIVSKTIRDGNWIGRGYAREDFYDSWERYLPQPMPPAATATSATSATNGGTNGHDMSQEERVDLMMKHNGLSREQAEAEAAEWN